MSDRKGSLIAFVVTLAGLMTPLFACAGPSHRASDDWRGKQETWWTDLGVAKASILSNLDLLATVPPSRESEAARWNSATLMLIADSKNDAHASQFLTEMSSYYLGESGDELHRCLVLRKGPSIVEALKLAAKHEGMDCSSKRIGVCKTDAEYREYLSELIAEISRNQPCQIER